MATRRIAAVLMAAAAVTTEVAYWIVIGQQGGPEPGNQLVVVISVLLPFTALAALLRAVLPENRTVGVLLLAGTVFTGAMGILAIFSIGLAFLTTCAFGIVSLAVPVGRPAAPRARARGRNV